MSEQPFDPYDNAYKDMPAALLQFLDNPRVEVAIRGVNGKELLKKIIIDAWGKGEPDKGAEQSEKHVCPCGSDRTYKTEAFHCTRCAVTTEVQAPNKTAG